jgi:hypothetical protein
MPDATGKLPCHECKRRLEPIQFYPNRTTPSGRQHKCIECSRVWIRKWATRRRDRLKALDPEALKQAEAAKRAKDPRTYWARATVGAIRVRCKQHGWPCDLTYEYLLSIVGDSCPVFGTPYDFTGGSKRGKPNSPSVDRIIPARYYIKDNVVIVSMRANWLKRDATITELQQLARYYSALHSQSVPPPPGSAPPSPAA